MSVKLRTSPEAKGRKNKDNNSTDNNNNRHKKHSKLTHHTMDRSSGSTGGPYQRPVKGPELKRLKRIAMMASVGASVFMAIAFSLAYSGVVKLYPSNVSADTLTDYVSKMEFTVKYQVLLVLWLVIGVHIVIYNRLTKGALNPLTESTEYPALASKFILTNSFEQILISLFAQLIFIAFADGDYVIKIIPIFNIVQFIGRIAFFAGYPQYRTFGMMLTLGPNTLMVQYDLFKFFSFINPH